MRDLLRTIYENILRNITKIPASTTNAWREDIFPTTFWLVVIISLLSVLLFYYFFNKLYSSYNGKGNWFATLFLNAFICGGVAITIVLVAIKLPVKQILALILWYGTINFVYGLLLFLFGTLLLKWFSPNGRKVPF